MFIVIDCNECRLFECFGLLCWSVQNQFSILENGIGGGIFSFAGEFCVLKTGIPGGPVACASTSTAQIKTVLSCAHKDYSSNEYV